MASDDWHFGGFGIYIHWPFCAAKCPYCDFNSHVRQSVDHGRWQAALLREIANAADETPGRTVSSIFFGGGTPSLMDPAVTGAVIAEIAYRWTLSPDIEITLEANPTSVEASRFAGFRDAGVNRVSMGIQALNDFDLKALGRLHSVAEARAAFDLARKQFPRVSFDLIYARQNQSRQAWTAELQEACAMAIDHLSLYQLTIEPGTRFDELHQKGRLRGLPKNDHAADMYLATQDACAAAGMPGYEISNHARPGSESRHNLIYWRYGDYAGIGPGAHGRLTLSDGRYATETIRAPEAWLEAVEKVGTGRSRCETVERGDQAEEYLMMSLRLAEGASLGRFHRLSGRHIDEHKINELCADGFLIRDRDRIRASDAGRPVLNGILRRLLT